MDLLAKTRLGNFSLMKEKIRAVTANGQIMSNDLVAILSHDGALGDFDAKKVVQYFDV